LQNECQSLFVSEQHNKAENSNIRANPGPGYYADIDMDAVKIHHPVAAFPKVTQISLLCLNALSSQGVGDPGAAVD
jgi:hypothetical protein